MSLGKIPKQFTREQRDILVANLGLDDPAALIVEALDGAYIPTGASSDSSAILWRRAGFDYKPHYGSETAPGDGVYLIKPESGNLVQLIANPAYGITRFRRIPATVTYGEITNAAHLVDFGDCVANFGLSIDGGVVLQRLPALGDGCGFVALNNCPLVASIPPVPEGCTSITASNCTGLLDLPAFPSNFVYLQIDGCNFSKAKLDEFMVRLAACDPGGTVTITGNPGAATCDTSPATANGWTVIN